jgi:hypothetical protein
MIWGLTGRIWEPAKVTARQRLCKDATIAKPPLRNVRKQQWRKCWTGVFYTVSAEATQGVSFELWCYLRQEDDMETPYRKDCIQNLAHVLTDLLSGRLSRNIKLTLCKTLIRWVMTHACPTWEYGADAHLLKLQRLQNTVLRPIGNLDSSPRTARGFQNSLRVWLHN